MMTSLSLKDTPSLIERLLPVQKLSAESYKEQMAVHGKTLTALGSYWKGRKPLIVAKACVLGSLLPATDDPVKDLQVFEQLMGMDDESFPARWKRRPTPKDVLETASLARIEDYFTVQPPGLLPVSSPVDWSQADLSDVRVSWRDGVTELERRQLEFQALPKVSYRDKVGESRRPEEVIDTVHEHIWDSVNGHLGTDAHSFPELMDQLGVMRFGHRPKVADTFCGSGQIPFEAARLGCDVYASDLNPVASMLTWGALNIVGGSEVSRKTLKQEQDDLVGKVQSEIGRLGIETDGQGWQAKVYLYCVEVQCPQTGWMVPLIPSLIVSKGYKVIVDLIPDSINKRYDVQIRSGVTNDELSKAELGTVRTDGRGQDPYMIHTVGEQEYRVNISELRGDYRTPDGNNANRLRRWEKEDFKPRTGDILQERLYCIQWMRPKGAGKTFDYEFRSVTSEDLAREAIVEDFIAARLADWQDKGLVPDMQIESGAKTDEPIRTRGWTHWHHLFNPRQLLIGGLVNRYGAPGLKFGLAQMLNMSCRLSRVDNSPKGAGATKGAFDNQALNTLLNYGCRGSVYSLSSFNNTYKSFPLNDRTANVFNIAADQITEISDIYITDPPYGDAVRYEEILEFFIAWLRKNPPPEFADWIWDSRRSMAITGEGQDFRQGMVSAYKRMTECMPDNGIQVIMFTHQSGSIWADMANIVWASGLQATAAWYVATETDSALREGKYVKGTVLLVCRKRAGSNRITRDDLAWEIQEEVEAQIESLTGLNQDAKGIYRDENLFEDADLQMAGYAAALRCLTKYATIDGRDMVAESVRPRIRGESTFVDDLIAFAVDTANQCLVPQGIDQTHWDKLNGTERFYLKMLDLESKGARKIDNYQNFAKAFKVTDFHPLLASQSSNDARLLSAVELGSDEMSEGSEFHQSTLRALLYGVMELEDEVDGNEVLTHLSMNIPNYYGDQSKREMVVNLGEYLERKFAGIGNLEASSVRVLVELVKNQRLG